MRNKLSLLILCLVSLITSVMAQPPFDPIQDHGAYCDKAIFLCGYELDGFSSTLPTENLLLPQPEPGCPNSGGDIDNIIWYSFIAEASNLEIEIDFSDCFGGAIGEGLQIGLFGECDFSNKLACDEANNYETLNLIPDPATIIPGNLYYIYLDGYGGAICDFNIDVISGVCTEEPLPIDNCMEDCGVSNSFGDFVGCVGFVENYIMPKLEDQINANVESSCHTYSPAIDIKPIAAVEWEILPNTGTGFNIITANPKYLDSLEVRPSISIEWLEPGVYTIRPIITYNPLISICGLECNCLESMAYTVTISPSDVVTLPDIELCPGECVEYCNATYCVDATITCYDRDNCAIETQNIFSKPISFIDLGDYYICESSCFIFNGVEFCTENVFSIPSDVACDTSYMFELIELDLTVELDQADVTLDCNNGNATMIGSWNTNYPGNVSGYWISELGDTVSFSESYTTTTPGIYTFHAVPEDNTLCVVTIDHEVTQNNDGPSIDISTPNLDCNTTTDDILVMSTDIISSVSWTGPNNFESSDLSPEVTEGGEYTGTFIGDNGCITIETINITADFADPVFEIQSNNFTCTENLVVAQYTSTSDIQAIEWTLPDGSTSTEQVLNLPTVGQYSLQVTGTNGCIAEEFFNVMDESFDPSLNLPSEYMWLCDQEILNIDISTLLSDSISHTWSILEGDYSETENGIDISMPGIYILSSIHTLSECTGTDTLYVTGVDNPLIAAAFVTSDARCEGADDATILSVETTGGEEPFIYSIDNVEYSSFEDITLGGGSQTITITDANGCSVSEEVIVEEAESVLLDVDSEISVKYGDRQTLTVFYNIADDEVADIFWYDGQGEFIGQGKEIIVTANNNETITVELTDINGCISTAMINLLIDFEVDIHYPNIFSPNGDGQNDIFLFFNKGNPENMDLLLIYDRAGELIYVQNGLSFNETTQGWDGTFNGQPVVAGVYVFIMKYTLGNGENRTMSGSITVMR